MNLSGLYSTYDRIRKNQASPRQMLKIVIYGFKAGNQFETLLGVTGSGKTFTMANVIAGLNKPTLIISHNKTMAGQLYGEMKGFFPNNAVEYFVSYYVSYRTPQYLVALIPIKINILYCKGTIWTV